MFFSRLFTVNGVVSAIDDLQSLLLIVYDLTHSSYPRYNGLNTHNEETHHDYRELHHRCGDRQAHQGATTPPSLYKYPGVRNQPEAALVPRRSPRDVGLDGGLMDILLVSRRCGAAVVRY